MSTRPLVVIACAVLVGVSTPASAATTSRTVLTGQRGFLTGVAVLGARNVWAVGAPAAGSGTITEHRRGQVWHRVASPPRRSITAQLLGVTAVGGGRLWAVGSAGARTMAARWTGHRWVRVPTPSPGSDGTLNDVAAVTRSDVWAVGSHLDAGQENSRTLIEHWNGSRWRRVGSPNPSSFDSLTAVSAVSARSVWAVGSTDVGTLVLHWNGRHWRRVPSPGSGGLLGVEALSAANVWAVGSDGARAQILHWNGRRWRSVPSPQPGRFSLLSGVDAAGARDVWTVGWVQPRGGQHTRSFVLHWNGTRWRVVPSPSVAGRNTVLNAVAVRTSGDVWGVGYSGDGANARVVAMRWDGTRWRLR
jgi:hypothetical protein